MRLKILPYLLLGLLISIFAYNQFYLKKQIDKAKEAENKRITELELNYTKKNLTLNLLKEEFGFPASVEKKVMVYIPNNACASCVDKLLLILGDYEIDQKIMIIVDSKEQIEYITGFNDRFLYTLDTEVGNKLIKNYQNNLVVYSTSNNEINRLLTFILGEELFFTEFFENYLL